MPDRADLAAVREREIEHNRDLARASETFARVVALDVSAWRLACFTLLAEPPAPSESRDLFEIAHLAKPGTSELG